VLPGRDLCVGLITRPDLEVSIMRRHWPTRRLWHHIGGEGEGKVCYDRLSYRVRVYVSRLTFELAVGDERNLVLHTLNDWVRFSPRSSSLTVNKFCLGYAVHLLYLGQFMSVVSKFTLITSV
jgi:hypothetical protein